mmetsp:Transcript_39783/g.89293  ORF Transcript_39783/g.89293 Transcript_39783/m.89293 type:complete len:303 (+) Transcript_39783:713-1621(+)
MVRAEERAVQLVEYVEERHTGLMADIDAHFDKLHAMLEERKAALLADAREFHSSRALTPLSDLVGRLRATRARGQQLSDTLGRAVAEDGPEAEEMRRRAALDRKMREWQETCSSLAGGGGMLSLGAISRRFPSLDTSDATQPAMHMGGRLRLDTAESVRVSTGLQEITHFLDLGAVRPPAQNWESPAQAENLDPRGAQDARQAIQNWKATGKEELKQQPDTGGSGVSTHSGGISNQPTPATPPRAAQAGAPQIERAQSLSRLAPREDDCWDTNKGAVNAKPFQRPSIVPKLNLDRLNAPQKR